MSSLVSVTFIGIMNVCNFNTILSKCDIGSDSLKHGKMNKDKENSLKVF